MQTLETENGNVVTWGLGGDMGGKDYQGYSFLDDKQPSNLCLNTSSNGELTILQGFKLSLTFFSTAFPPRIPLSLISPTHFQ